MDLERIKIDACDILENNLTEDFRILKQLC